MHSQKGLPREAVVCPSLKILKSQIQTGPRPEQPDLVRPVLSRELH